MAAPGNPDLKAVLSGYPGPCLNLVRLRIQVRASSGNVFNGCAQGEREAHQGYVIVEMRRDRIKIHHLDAGGLEQSHQSVLRRQNDVCSAGLNGLAVAKELKSCLPNPVLHT